MSNSTSRLGRNRIDAEAPAGRDWRAMAMSWIGLEDTAAAGGPHRVEPLTDWVVRLRVGRRSVGVRISAASEQEAHRRARQFGADYTLARL